MMGYPIFFTSLFAIFGVITGIINGVTINLKQSKLHTTSADPYRLSTEVVPHFYTLTLKPDLDNGTFSGTVTIDVEVKSSIPFLQLHSVNLPLDKIFIDRASALYVIHPEYNDNILIFKQNKTDISQGNHKIFLKFRGSLIDKEDGFFKTNYKHNGTILSELAVTNFQPRFARTAFPCFDEPALKARFKLTLVTPHENYTALSSMPLKKKITTSEGTFFKFETSVLMPVYLLAFVVAQNYSFFEKNVKIKDRDVPIRVYSYNPTNESSWAVLNYASAALKYYAEYLDLPDPMPKIDMIEFDRSRKGMENWGLITASRNFLQTEMDFNVFEVCHFVTHEIAHFWFGNLVTNYWWNDLWLHESLAEHMSLKAVDFILNTTYSQFPNATKDDFIYINDMDGGEPPLVSEVQIPSPIFSHAIYEKGPILLRMLERNIGEENFKKALQEFVRKFQFATARAYDFINIFEQFDDTGDLRSFLETYIFQKYCPVIKISEDVDQNAYNLTQVKLFHGGEINESPYRYKWTIPLTYVTNLNERKPGSAWFDKDMDNLIIPKSNESWIKVNYRQTGYYKTIYSDQLWQKLGNHSNEISFDEKNYLLMEAAQLYYLKLVPCGPILEQIAKFNNHKHKMFSPLKLITTHLIYGGLTSDQKAFQIFANYHSMITEDPIWTEEYPEDNYMDETTGICAKWIKKHLSKYISS